MNNLENKVETTEEVENVEIAVSDNEAEIERVKMFKATKAILKSKSPSCGVDEIYDGTFTKTLIQGDGVFVKELKKLGIEILTELDF